MYYNYFYKINGYIYVYEGYLSKEFDADFIDGLGENIKNSIEGNIAKESDISYDLNRKILIKIGKVETISEDKSIFHKAPQSFINANNPKLGKRSYSTSSRVEAINTPLLDTSSNPPLSGITLEKKSLLFEYSPVYIAIEKLLKSSKSSLEKQQEMEKLLNESWVNLYISKLNSSEHNKDYVKLFSIYIKDFGDSLSNFLNNIKNKDSQY